MPDPIKVHSLNNACGGIGLRIILAVASLALLVGAVMFFIGNFRQQQQLHLRHAEQISIDGLQDALMRLDSLPQSHDAVSKAKSGDGWYAVSFVNRDSLGIPYLTVIVEGHSGAAVKRQMCVLSWLSTAAKTGWVQQSLRQD